jgi:hypothetical protein
MSLPPQQARSRGAVAGPSETVKEEAYASVLRASWPCLSTSLALTSSASAPASPLLSPMAICSSSLATASAMRLRRGPKTFLVSSAACFCGDMSQQCSA